MRQKRPIVAKILCGLLVCALVAGYSLPEVSAAEQEGQKTEEKSTEEVFNEQMSEEVSDTLDMQSLDEPETLEQTGPGGTEEVNQGVSVISLPEGVESSGKCGDDVSYTLTEIEEGKYSLKITGSGPMSDFALRGNRAPWLQVNYQIAELTIDNGITSIGKNAFGNFEALTEVTLPDSVVRIEDNAFKQCYQLSKINLPAGLQKIGTSAFENCDALDAVDIPGGVADWGEGNNFRFCDGLNTVRLSDGTQEIPPNMFNRCEALETIEIPASVTKIGENAFKDCTGLKTIHFGGRSDEWSELLKTAGTGNDVLSSGDVNVICEAEGKYKLTISRDTPGYFSKRTAEAGGKIITGSETEDVFMYVPAGETVTFDGELAETESPVWGIAGIMDYDSRLYFIDYLEWKDGKRTIEMPAKDTEISFNVILLACGDDNGGPDPLLWDIDRIDGGDSLKMTITGSGPMETGGANETEYWKWHRWKSQIAELSLPEGLTYIGSNAFSLCTSLRKVEIPTSVRGLGYHAFYSSGLTEVTVPGIALCPIGGGGGEYGQTGLNYGQGAFEESKLLEKAEILDSGVPLNLGWNIFGGCTNLKELILPNSIESMPRRVFHDVPPLETVYFRGTEEEWEELKANIDPDGNEAILNAKKVVYRYGWPEVTGSETNTDGSVTVTVSSIGSGDSFTEGELSEVTVDGKAVDPANYTLTGGKLTFLSSYMDTLKEGAHEIVLKYADGKEAVATITVTKTSSVNPQPGQGTGSGTGTGTGSGSAGGTGTGNGTNAGSNNAGNGSSTAVQTGDPAQTGVWGALLLASLASIGCVACSRRRRRRSII